MDKQQKPSEQESQALFKKREITGMFKGPVLPLLIRLSLPMFMGMFFQLLYNVVDIFFISRIDIHDPSYVGGVGLTWPVVFFAIAMGNGLTVGISSLVARAIGEKNQDVLNKTAESGLAIAVVLSAVTIAGIWFFGSEIVTAMGGVGDYHQHALDYLIYIMPTAVILYVGTVFIGILQGEGLMKQVMIAMIIGTVGNLILDPIFIFVLGLDVKGAAIATGLGQFTAILYVLSFFLRRKTLVPIQFKLKNIRLKIVMQIIEVGVPQALGQILMSFSTLFYNRFLITINVLSMTAFTLCSRTEQVVLMTSFAIGAAVITIVGQNAGRGNMKRIARVMRSSFLTGAVAVLFFGTLMILFAGKFYGIFSSNAEVIRYAILQTYWLEYTYIFAGFGIISRSFFQAVGYPKPALLLTFMRVIFISVPAAFFFGKVLGWDVGGVWLGIGAGSVISGIFSIIWVFTFIKRLKKGKRIIQLS